VGPPENKVRERESRRPALTRCQKCQRRERGNVKGERAKTEVKLGLLQEPDKEREGQHPFMKAQIGEKEEKKKILRKGNRREISKQGGRGKDI